MPNLYQQYTDKLSEDTQNKSNFQLPALNSQKQPVQQIQPIRQTTQGVAKISQQKSALISSILGTGLRRNARPDEVARALFNANQQTGFYSLSEIDNALKQYERLQSLSNPQAGQKINIGGREYDTTGMTWKDAKALQKERAKMFDDIQKQAKVVNTFKEAEKVARKLQEMIKNDEGFTAIVGTRSPIGWMLTKKVDDPTKPGEKKVIGRQGTEAANFRNVLDQFIQILTLQARQDIKGQGTITDNETEMLRKAQTFLDPSLKEEAFKQELNDMIDKLDLAIRDRIAMTGADKLDFSKIQELPDDQARVMYKQALEQAKQNPEDPQKIKLLYANALGMIDPATGKPVPDMLVKNSLAQPNYQEQQSQADEGGTLWLKPGDTFIFGKNGLLQNVGKALGDYAGRMPEIFAKTARDIADGARAYGQLIDYAVNRDDEQLAQFAEEMRNKDKADYIQSLDFAGASGKLLSDLVGAGFELADDATGEVVSKTLGNVIEGAIATEGGQKALEAVKDGAEKWHEYERENPEQARRIRNLVEIGEGVLAYYTAKSAIQGTKQIFGALKNKMGKVKQVSDIIKENTKVTGNDGLISKTGGLVDKTKDKVGETTSNLIDKYHEGVVSRRLARAGKSKQKIAKVIKKAGFDDKQSKLIATLKPKDRAVAKKMVQLADKIEKGSGRITARPIDYVGKNMLKKQAKIDALKRVKGAKLGKVAKSLQDKKFDSKPIQEAVVQSMDDLGIKVLDNGAYDFSNSVFKNLPALQKRLVQAFEQAKNIGDNPYQAHIFKKSIDELVNYGTQGEGLKGTAEMTLKGLRKATDDALDLAFPKYATINSEYRELANVSMLNRELFGKAGASPVKAGQKLRSVFSNASVSRDKTLNYLGELEKVAQKYGVQTGDNVLDQALFAQALEKPYGSFTDTALANEVGKGIQEGLNTANSVRSPLRLATNVAGKIYNNVTTKTPEVQKQLLRKLFGLPSKQEAKGIQSLMQYFKDNGGATYNAMKNKLVTSRKGYVVSPYIKRTKIINGKNITASQLRNYIQKNRDLLRKSKHNLGLWFDKDSGKTFLDTVIVVPKESQAVNIGKKFNQISVWDLFNNKEIPVGGTGGLTP